MDIPAISDEARSSEKTFRLISYALVALMMACAALTVVSMLSHLFPPWQPWFIAVICFLVALDRLYTYHIYKDMTFLGPDWIADMATQWFVILVIAKLITSLSRGLEAFWAEIPLWQKDFATYFFNNEFMMVLVIVILTWLVCGNFASLLNEIGLSQALIEQDAFIAAQGKPSARERLLSLFFTTGSILVLFTALARLDLRAILAGRSGSFFVELPALAGGGASTLLYFMLGLALLSQTQLMALHVRWNIQRIPVSSKLAGRWALYSALFLVAMAVVVSLLPTSYSLSPLAVLGYLLNLIFILLVFVLQVVFQFVLAIILLVLTPLFLLLGLKAPDNGEGVKPPDLPPPPTNAGNAPLTPDWFEYVKSLAFWAVFLGLLIFAVTQYLRQHDEALDALRRLPGWRFLEQAWQWMRGLWASARSSVSRVVAAGRERLLSSSLPARELLGNGFINLRRLDPRQQVTFFYLALVRRGAESGLSRRESQTPYEYAATLERALPDADQDIDSLTDAFIEARYSRRPVPPEKASLVKRTWERLRKALRGKRKIEATSDE